MAIITFERIEDRGRGLVAVFTHPDGRESHLNRASLEQRIANVEGGLAHPDRDASVEHGALRELINAATKAAERVEARR